MLDEQSIPVMTSAGRDGENEAKPETGCDLSVLIVGYNSLSYLRDCLNSIADSITSSTHEVLFVNNGSDGSEDFVRNRYPHVRVLESLGNVGFAAGNDYLADHANGRWLLLLNPDTKLYPGALDVLLDSAIRYPQYDVLGGVTVAENGEPEILGRLELPSFLTLLRTLIFGSNRSASPHPNPDIVEVEALNGGFMMVRRDRWTDLGGFDREFFLYAEELDFFKRLKTEGGKAAQVTNSLLFHDFGSGDVYSPQRVRFLVTGNAHYFHKHFSPAYAYACIFILWATALKRFLGGRLLALASDRYSRMSRGFAAVAMTPWSWIWGYNSKGSDPRKRA